MSDPAAAERFEGSSYTFSVAFERRLSKKYIRNYWYFIENAPFLEIGNTLVACAPLPTIYGECYSNV